MLHLIEQIPHLPGAADAVESHRIRQSRFGDLPDQVTVIVTFQRVSVCLNGKHDDDEGILRILPDIPHGVRDPFRGGIGLKNEMTDAGIDKLTGDKAVFLPSLSILQPLDGTDITEDLRIIALCRFPCHCHRLMDELVDQRIVAVAENAVGVVGVGQDGLAARLQILLMDILDDIPLLQYGKFTVLAALSRDGGKIGSHGSVHEQHAVFDLFSYIH